MLEALSAAPGSGPSALAKASGVSTAVAAATLSRLVKQGRMRRIEPGRYAVGEASDGRSAAAPTAATRPAQKTVAAHATQAPPPTDPASDDLQVSLGHRPRA
jgi:DNA-binding IclR family transcriptional regulator